MCRIKAIYRLYSILRQSSSMNIVEILDNKQHNKSVRTTMCLKWTFWDIFGHFMTSWDILGHFGTLWDNLEDFTTSLEH